MEILCDSVEETKRFAFDFATKVEKGAVISLNGNQVLGKQHSLKVLLKVWV